MLIITLETGGQDSSSFPQAFNYQPLNTQTTRFRFFSLFSKFNSSCTCSIPAAHVRPVLGIRVLFVASESLASCESIAVQGKWLWAEWEENETGA